MTTAAERLRTARQQVVDDASLVGAALRAALTEVADRWLEHELGDVADVAVVAVGGYGRGEPAPASDLDLVLVHRGCDVKEVADRLWYPIWDAGVRLDHSVRTVGEAAAVARDDLKAMLGLLDARHVAGDPALTDELRQTALTAWRRDARRRLPELHEQVRERSERHGELGFLLEPDLKECRGGLRDVHAMRAVAAAWVADPPTSRVTAAAQRLLDVRGELHRRTGRAGDILVQQEQAPVAQSLGLPDADELMRQVYAAGRDIAFAADETWRRALTAIAPPRRWRTRALPRRPVADGVVEQSGEIVLARDAEPNRDPWLVLRVAAAAAQHALPISPHTIERLAAESPPPPQPWPPQARDAFVALLGAGPRTVDVVETLDQAGLFVRLLPEWDAVRCKPQRNPVHRFTVDRHLVEAAVEASRLTRHVSRPDLLLVAALLHDLGKGWPGDHTDAGVRRVPAVARRMGFDEADVDVLTSLVRHHLLLADTATRRDLDDPATAAAVAAAVGRRSTLELLHALTQADALATGPAAWGDWKARLVGELVARTAAVLAGEPAPAPTALVHRVHPLVAARDLAVDVDGSTVTVVAPDRPGLMWRWAGVLALHRLQIHAATATSVAGMAVTAFEVSPRFGSAPDWTAVRADVRRAWDDALPIAAHLSERERAYVRAELAWVPARVLWVDAASEISTVVEVRAHDSVGLLYRLARALAECGLDVRAARVSTLGAEAVDAFYVAEPDGAPVIDAARRAQVEAALLAACAPAAPSPH